MGEAEGETAGMTNSIQGFWCPVLMALLSAGIIASVAAAAIIIAKSERGFRALNASICLSCTSLYCLMLALAAEVLGIVHA